MINIFSQIFYNSETSKYLTVKRNLSNSYLQATYIYFEYLTILLKFIFKFEVPMTLYIYMNFNVFFFNS